jgi:hypothetical protein
MYVRQAKRVHERKKKIVGVTEKKTMAHKRAPAPADLPTDGVIASIIASDAFPNWILMLRSLAVAIMWRRRWTSATSSIFCEATRYAEAEAELSATQTKLCLLS